MPDANLLLVGFVKCGTTSLSMHLAAHPDISTPAIKELYHLIDSSSPLTSMRPAVSRQTGDGHLPNQSARSYSEYFPIENRRYALDATPWYYSQETAFRYATCNPGVKTIFMLRDPVRRIVSSYRFFQGMLQEYPTGSFTEFVEALVDKYNTKGRYRMRIRKDFFKYAFDSELDMGCYEQHISKWLSAIGEKRVFIGKMEDLRDDPKRLMIRLCSFLDLDPGIYSEFDFAAFFQSYSVRFGFLQKIGRRLAREDPMRYDRLGQTHSPFHPIAGHRTRKLFERVYRTLQERQDRIESRAIDLLAEFYRPHNVRLRERFSIDYVQDGLAAARRDMRK